MFKWLKRRHLYEQEKLLYQNDMAAAYLQGYFDRDPEIKRSLIKLVETNRSVTLEIGGGSSIANAGQLEELLQANKKLRELYSATLSAQQEGFDQFCEPPGGWRAYYATVVRSR